MSEEKRYSLNQLDLVKDLCETHGLQPEQISFDGDDLNPIFDYEAISLLSLRLSDIRSIDCSRITRDGSGRSTCECTVTLPDGRSRTVSETAEIGEELGSGTKIGDSRLADSVARSRASRLGIRSVGVNLYNAHKRFKETGQIAAGTTDNDPRAAKGAELHALAAECGLIKGSDRSRYEAFIAESFDGATSSKDLNDIDLQRLLNQLRAMARHARCMDKVSA
jgi:hypothetical protein